MELGETRITGQHGALVAQIARTETQIGETELQILNIDQTRQSEAHEVSTATETNMPQQGGPRG